MLQIATNGTVTPKDADGDAPSVCSPANLGERERFAGRTAGCATARAETLRRWSGRTGGTRWSLPFGEPPDAHPTTNGPHGRLRDLAGLEAGPAWARTEALPGWTAAVASYRGANHGGPCRACRCRTRRACPARRRRRSRRGAAA